MFCSHICCCSNFRNMVVGTEKQTLLSVIWLVIWNILNWILIGYVVNAGNKNIKSLIYKANCVDTDA